MVSRPVERNTNLLASLQMPNSLNTMGTCLILRPFKRESIILIVLLLLPGLSLHFFLKKPQRTSAVSPYKEAILQWHAVIFLPVEGKAMMYKTSPLMGLQDMGMGMLQDSPMMANHLSLLPTLRKLLSLKIQWAMAAWVILAVNQFPEAKRWGWHPLGCNNDYMSWRKLMLETSSCS